MTTVQCVASQYAEVDRHYIQQLSTYPWNEDTCFSHSVHCCGSYSIRLTHCGSSVLWEQTTSRHVRRWPWFTLCLEIRTWIIGEYHCFWACGLISCCAPCAQGLSCKSMGGAITHGHIAQVENTVIIATLFRTCIWVYDWPSAKAACICMRPWYNKHRSPRIVPWCSNNISPSTDGCSWHTQGRGVHLRNVLSYLIRQHVYLIYQSSCCYCTWNVRHRRPNSQGVYGIHEPMDCPILSPTDSIRSAGRNAGWKSSDLFKHSL